jgi:rod shape-determining protein MreC
MESFFGRHKNPLVLMAVLFVQIIALATQVKRPSDPNDRTSRGTRLIRVWAVTAFTPLERGLVNAGHFLRYGWHNYVDLHDVRQQNQQLQEQVTRLRMEEVRLKEDAEQGRRLQFLLGFREKFISQTLAAQVIGVSGSDQSHVIYIDKAARDGIKTDMAVITPDGIVGKIRDVFSLSSQVLMINDRDSGAGVILEKTRLQGVLRGTSGGELQVEGVMADQTVEVGDRVITSGGDRIYPKGLPVGTVISIAPDRDTGTFLIVKIKPAADLNRLEEVLVITKMADQVPDAEAGDERTRASDILSQRLPTVPEQQPPVTPDAGEQKNVKTAADAKNQADKNPAAGTSAPSHDRKAVTVKAKTGSPGSQASQTQPQKAPAGPKPDKPHSDEKKGQEPAPPAQQPPGPGENPTR